ncbi:Tyrosine-protein kinase Btk29A [Pseudolycoriella hygida]|uniref:Tyrosine-protein kinase Btk29A n=1 Tax=Pseudolycoriella hygida TaxID=35572 RepID=A0A9Q0NFZ7_9DIPT|nr:Tyrosine-protein kinase Btk29A [Pseudolycoriella hygida]
MSERLYDIVKCGSMTKRSQNKKRFTPVNYKLRWFELTKHFLSYFDIENVEKNYKAVKLLRAMILSLTKRRERGRISIKGVRLVEPAVLNSDGDSSAPDGFSFQIGYCETDDQLTVRSLPQYTLYLVAANEKERTEWIAALRAVCEEKNTPKLYRYHPGLWLGKKWSCCKNTKRIAFGCQAATHWSETNNNPKQLPELKILINASV